MEILTYEILERSNSKLVYRTQYEIFAVNRGFAYLVAVIWAAVIGLTLPIFIIYPFETLSSGVPEIGILCIFSVFIYCFLSGKNQINMTIDKDRGIVVIGESRISKHSDSGVGVRTYALTKMTPLGISVSFMLTKINCLYFMTSRYMRYYIYYDKDLEGVLVLKKIIEEFLL